MDSDSGTDDEDTLDSDDEYDAPKKTKRVEKIRWNEIPLEPTALASFADRVEQERRVQYRQHAEKVKGWIDTVDNLELPSNPLDRLLNELGGPEEVAELTGRKTRQVQVYDAMKDKMKVVFERRKGDGPMDQVNIEEKNNFQSGVKKVSGHGGCLFFHILTRTLKLLCGRVPDCHPFRGSFHGHLSSSRQTCQEPAQVIHLAPAPVFFLPVVAH